MLRLRGARAGGVRRDSGTSGRLGARPVRGGRAVLSSSSSSSLRKKLWRRSGGRGLGAGLSIGTTELHSRLLGALGLEGHENGERRKGKKAVAHTSAVGSAFFFQRSGCGNTSLRARLLICFFVISCLVCFWCGQEWMQVTDEIEDGMWRGRGWASCGGGFWLWRTEDGVCEEGGHSQ